MISKHLNLSIFILLFSSLMTSVCFGDHGREFLLVQTARLGNSGNIFIIARQDYTREEGRDKFVFEPLLSWTVRDWISLEVSADAEKVQGESLNYEATVPGIRIRLTPKGKPLEMGVAARYDVSADSQSNDTLKISGLGTYQVNGWLLGANLNYKKQKGIKQEWGFAMGVKRELRHHLSLGLEVSGSLEEKKSGEVVAGLYYELNHGMQINAGVGTGFNSDVDFTAKTAFI
ncbi:MAG: hypothetical protein JKY89_09055, partial [Immundisolibacteraceae bacterium]|nr:hypothetical protein [Immundisolibacteraceae bacterium]